MYWNWALYLQIDQRLGAGCSMGRIKIPQFKRAFLIHPKGHQGSQPKGETKLNLSRGHRAIERGTNEDLTREMRGPNHSSLGIRVGTLGSLEIHKCSCSIPAPGSIVQSPYPPVPFPSPSYSSGSPGRQEPDSGTGGRPRHPSDLDAVSGPPEPQFPQPQGPWHI